MIGQNYQKVKYFKIVAQKDTRATFLSKIKSLCELEGSIQFEIVPYSTNMSLKI